ncbi:MAG: membrane protein [Phycisphaerae bacterium]|nr:MAG: membrane protein [Phycisphaerae bacterium]
MPPGAFTPHPSTPRLALILLALTLALLTWSGIQPKDRVTWWLEVAPALAAMLLLAATYRRFPFTRLAYVLMFLHAALLIVGGHYTYAEVPLGLWVKDWLGLERNHYDRLGHFVQGFVPAIVAREVLLRLTPLRPGGWLAWIIVSMCTGIAALYELLEWAVAEIDQSGSAAFLGMQGDIWDTQKDMALCAVGAAVALITLSRVHNRALRTG